MYMLLKPRKRKRLSGQWLLVRKLNIWEIHHYVLQLENQYLSTYNLLILSDGCFKSFLYQESLLNICKHIFNSAILCCTLPIVCSITMASLVRYEQKKIFLKKITLFLFFNFYCFFSNFSFFFSFFFFFMIMLVYDDFF